jgi:hypothetical protein
MLRDHNFNSIINQILTFVSIIDGSLVWLPNDETGSVGVRVSASVRWTIKREEGSGKRDQGTTFKLTVDS